MRIVVPVQLDISFLHLAMHYFTDTKFLYKSFVYTFMFNVVILQIYWMQQLLSELSAFMYPTLILITYTT